MSGTVFCVTICECRQEVCSIEPAACDPCKLPSVSLTWVDLLLAVSTKTRFRQGNEGLEAGGLVRGVRGFSVLVSLVVFVDLCGVLGNPLMYLGIRGGSLGFSWDHLGCPWTSWAFLEGPWGVPGECQGLPRIYTYIYIYIYIWHLLICFVHTNYEEWACTQSWIFGIALGPALVPLLGPPLPSEARHARSEATRIVTASCT